MNATKQIKQKQKLLKQFSNFFLATFLLMSFEAHTQNVNGDLPALEHTYEQSVEIASPKNPLIRSYKAVLKGLGAFDLYHDLAPSANLQFLARNKISSKVDTNVELRFVSDSGSIKIPVDKTGKFSVSKNALPNDLNAELIFNRSRDLFEVSPLVRSPNISVGEFRLGDFRLECKVFLAIVKEEMSFVERNVFSLIGDQCESKKIKFFHRLNRNFSKIFLVFEGKKELLSAEYINYKKNLFSLPLGDLKYPNDTFIEIEYEEAQGK